MSFDKLRHMCNLRISLQSGEISVGRMKIFLCKQSLAGLVHAYKRKEITKKKIAIK